MIWGFTVHGLAALPRAVLYGTACPRAGARVGVGVALVGSTASPPCVERRPHAVLEPRAPAALRACMVTKGMVTKGMVSGTVLEPRASAAG